MMRLNGRVSRLEGRGAPAERWQPWRYAEEVEPGLWRVAGAGDLVAAEELPTGPLILIPWHGDEHEGAPGARY